MKKVYYWLIGSTLLTAFPSHTKEFASLSDFSVGVQGGYGFGRSNVQRRETYTFPGYQNKMDKSSLASEGIIGGLFVEYNHVLENSFFYGLSLNYILSKASGKFRTEINAGYPVSTSIKSKHSYSAAVRFGKVLNEYSPYLLIGVVTSYKKSVTDQLPATGSGSYSKYLPGIQFGGGVDFNISQTVSVGTEISRIIYKKFSYDLKNNAHTKVAAISIKPRESRAMLRLRFKLGNPFQEP